MGFIRLLDDALINKIAAGEVVERPASVVKELVENSLDAGASRITVELTEGGRKRILISDNGSGMDKEDAHLALKRHATSKIKSDEDLFNLNTMGFRGEALASIAAVSKFSLMTCKQGDSLGIKLYTEGGAGIDEVPWQSSGGTTLIIDDLFFNVPVRGKFLKTASTEYGNVLELMQSLALAHPNIDFTLVHNGKEQLRAPSVIQSDDRLASEDLWSEDAVRKRFRQIFKSESETPMVFATGESQYGSMQALVSAPGVEKGSGKDIFLFVNGRLVRDKGLRFAVLRGYHSHLLRGKFPIAIVNLKMDPSLVDVNVHPSKTEVRLQFASELQGMMAMAIREAIRKGEWVSEQESKSEEAVTEVFAQRPSPPMFPSRSPASTRPFGRAFAEPAVSHGFSNTKSLDLFATSEEPVVQSMPTRAQPSTESVPWEELTWLGSVDECYLLFSHGERSSGSSRLLVVDQHAFHERVIFERLCNNAKLLTRCQNMLVPEACVFKPEEIRSLKEIQPLMEKNGFKIGFLDEETVEVSGVPAILAKADVESLLRVFIDRVHSSVPIETNEGLAHDVLSTMACHSAVRAGEALGENELRELLKEASTVDFYHNCPHGRRVFRWFNSQQIGSWFDR